MPVRLERAGTPGDGAVAVVTLDRPERRNALDANMWADFDRVVGELEADLPRVVVVTGAGDRAFSAGMDVNPDNPQVGGLMTAVATHDRAPVHAMLAPIRGCVDRLVALRVPVIAAVNGLAYGGGAEIATRCDLRVADPAAVICFSEVTLGLMPDWGGGVALTRLLGPARAADLILTARKVAADEALALGLVNRVSAPGQALAEALAIAQGMAARGPTAIRFALEVIRRTPELPLADALALELDRAVALIASGECVPYITAFFSRGARG